jgi:hypothetical protein
MGEHIFLWLDHWHPDGALLDVYGHPVVHDVGSNIHCPLPSDP